LKRDETGIRTESNRSSTIDFKGVKAVKVNTIGKTKDYKTVVLGGTMTGEKGRAFGVLKGEGVQLLKMIYPRNLSVWFRPEGSWMDIKTMKGCEERFKTLQ